MFMTEKSFIRFSNHYNSYVHERKREREGERVKILFLCRLTVIFEVH